MKLRDLNGAIRKSGDKITIGLKAPDGREILIRVPRSSVLEGLKEAWPNGGETEIYLDDAGRLRYEGSTSGDLPAVTVADADETLDDDVLEDADEETLEDEPAPTTASADDDLDDLLG